MGAAINLIAVDDNQTNLDILQETLEDQYQVELALSGEECLAKLESSTPNIILLDVNMPNMNGYEVCKRIKSNPSTARIPVLFVSAMNALEERLAGYEAGGEDFVTKPFEPDELTAKIEVVLRNQQSLAGSENQAQEAMTAAMAAITSASELGKVIQFLEKTHSCKSYFELAKALLSVTSSMGLNCLVKIRAGDDPVCLDSSGSVKPIELDILEKLRSADRIISFSKRTLFNFDKAVLLVKNMPVDDNEKYGRLRDSLAVLLNGVESRVEFISVEEQKNSQQEQAKATLAQMHTSLGDIRTQFDSHQSGIGKIIKNLLEEIEVNITGLGLDDDQEAYFMNLVDREMTRVLDLNEFGDKMEQEFDEILANFSRTLVNS